MLILTVESIISETIMSVETTRDFQDFKKEYDDLMAQKKEMEDSVETRRKRAEKEDYFPKDPYENKD